jgi:hypothetical protein
MYTPLVYGFSKFSILIGWQAVHKTHIRTVVRIIRPVSRMSFIWRDIFALQTENFAF